MSNDETNAAIKSRLSAIFPDPATAARVVEAVVHSRPLGWSRKSNAPYYKEMYAEQMRAEADRMLASGNPLVYRYDKWCTDDTQMSKNTLYTRINQAVRYLVECMDAPDRRYSKWHDTTRTYRKSGVGVVIEFIPGLRGEDKSGFKADEIQPRENMPRWKREMEDWLESDSVTPFSIENLALGPDEIAELKVQFAQLSSVIASIKSSSIKIIRVNE